MGPPHPLRALAEDLAACGSHAAELHQVVTHFERFLAEFARAPVGRRSDLLAQAKADFTQVTGLPADRGQGRHFADRAIVYEEAHAPQGGVTLGEDLVRVLTDELAPAYDLTLLLPRLRRAGEREILRTWLAGRFGLGVPVGLGDFYAAYFADLPALRERTTALTVELDEVRREVCGAILAEADPGDEEVVLAPGRLAAARAHWLGPLGRVWSHRRGQGNPV